LKLCKAGDEREKAVNDVGKRLDGEWPGLRSPVVET
jgi:hypothetical protein